MKVSEAVINVAKFHENIDDFFVSKDGTECTLQVSKKHPVKMTRDEILGSGKPAKSAKAEKAEKAEKASDNENTQTPDIQ